MGVGGVHAHPHMRAVPLHAAHGLVYQALPNSLQKLGGRQGLKAYLVHAITLSVRLQGAFLKERAAEQKAMLRGPQCL